jgi:hypothetical protein
MPAYIPIPEGLTIPEEPEFELPVTFEMRDGQLYALAVDGMPLPEGEMEDEEMEEEPANFMAAVERGMTQR